MSELGTALDQARHWPVRYRRRQVIFDEGDAATAVYRLDRGCVRLQVNGREGHRQIVSFLFPGDMFGLSMDEHEVSAEAVTDVELTRYTLPSLVDLAARSSDVVFRLLGASGGLYGDLAHHVQHVVHLPAQERVLWFLTWLSRHDDRPEDDIVQLPMARRDVSDFLGLTPETLSRAITDLCAGGAIAPLGRRGFVLRRPFLEVRLRKAARDSVAGLTEVNNGRR